MKEESCQGHRSIADARVNCWKLNLREKQLNWKEK